MHGEYISNIEIQGIESKVDSMFNSIKFLEKRERRMLQMEKDRLLKIEVDKLRARLEVEKIEKERQEQEKKNREIEQSKNTRGISRSVENGNSQSVNLEVSFYCSCSICSGNWGGQTAMGIPVREGIVAMPKDVALGSKLHIDGLGEFLVADRGGYIKKVNGIYRVDVYVSSHEEALRRGRYNTTGVIYYK